MDESGEESNVYIYNYVFFLVAKGQVPFFVCDTFAGMPMSSSVDWTSMSDWHDLPSHSARSAKTRRSSPRKRYLGFWLSEVAIVPLSTAIRVYSTLSAER
jgi:hypothetical protein